MQWEFTPEQEDTLARLLLRGRQKPADAAVARFLRDAERIIDTWLQDEIRANPDELALIAEATGRLRRQLDSSNPTTRYALSMQFGGFMDSCRGFDVRDVGRETEKIEGFLERLQISACECVANRSPQRRKHRQHELLADLAVAHVRTFDRAPSTSRWGAFGKFAAELCTNILPPASRFAFGHMLLRDAVAAAKC